MPTRYSDSGAAKDLGIRTYITFPVLDPAGEVLVGIARPVAVTVSAGIASGDGFDPEALLRDADTALYTAKAAGRNAVATNRDA